jgi:hypothetical protein
MSGSVLLIKSERHQHHPRSSATRAAAKARSAVPAYKVNQEGIHGLPALQHGTRSQLCNKLLQKSIANELGSAIRLHNANSGGFHDRLESLHKRSFPQYTKVILPSAFLRPRGYKNASSSPA